MKFWARPDGVHSDGGIGKLSQSEKPNCIGACVTRKIEFKDDDRIDEISKFHNRIKSALELNINDNA